jgi:hypothetical protein
VVAAAEAPEAPEAAAEEAEEAEEAVVVVVVAAPAQAVAVVPALGEVVVPVRVARAQPERAQGWVAAVQPALAKTPVLALQAQARVVKRLLE